MGRIVIMDTVITTLGDKPRTIRITLPAGYDLDPSRRYPVIYMHDGQNLNDPAAYSGYSWDVERTLDRLQNQGRIDGVIVVGIDNGDDRRVDEYTAALDSRATRRLRRYLGGRDLSPTGEAFAAWVAEVLKPEIDRRYRTFPDRNHTATCGSSCGANIALHLGLVHGDVFGVIGAFSPALDLVASDLYPRIKAGRRDLRVYHDMGCREDRNPLGAATLWLESLRLQAILRRRLGPDRVMHVIDPQGRHTELVWQFRFPAFVCWAFPALTTQNKENTQ